MIVDGGRAMVMMVDEGWAMGMMDDMAGHEEIDGRVHARHWGPRRQAITAHGGRRGS